MTAARGGALTLDGFAGINLKLNTATIVDVGVTSATKVTLAANKDLACAAGGVAIHPVSEAIETATDASANAP